MYFDADAAADPNVAKAMEQLGRWLRSKGAEPQYIVTPGNPEDKTGADDFRLLVARCPDQGSQDPAARGHRDGEADRRRAGERAAAEMDGRYCWTAGFGWMRWDGRRWARTSDPSAIEHARQWVITQHADACDHAKGSPSASATDLIKAWQGYLSRSRLEAIVSLARGHPGS